MSIHILSDKEIIYKACRFPACHHPTGNHHCPDNQVSRVGKYHCLRNLAPISLCPWRNKGDCLSGSKSDFKITNANGKKWKVCKEKRIRSQRQRKISYQTGYRGFSKQRILWSSWSSVQKKTPPYPASAATFPRSEKPAHRAELL